MLGRRLSAYHIAGETDVRVTFSLPYHCQFGQNLSISGSAINMGQWDIGSCVDMEWTEGDIWKAKLSFPIEYFFLLFTALWHWLAHDQIRLVWLVSWYCNIHLHEGIIEKSMQGSTGAYWTESKVCMTPMSSTIQPADFAQPD